MPTTEEKKSLGPVFTGDDPDIALKSEAESYPLSYGSSVCRTTKRFYTTAINMMYF